MFIFRHYMKVLLLLCQLPLLTLQDDDEKKCPPITITEAKDQLRLNGGGPLGAYNKNYMAFTLDEVRRNFKNLFTMQPGNFSALAAWKPLTFPATMVVGTCINDSGGCQGCPVMTNLGTNSYPPFVNEVKCTSSDKLCGQGLGECKTTGVTQTFLKSSSNLMTCDKKPTQYFYEMNRCCQCRLL